MQEGAAGLLREDNILREELSEFPHAFFSFCEPAAIEAPSVCVPPPKFCAAHRRGEALQSVGGQYFARGNERRCSEGGGSIRGAYEAKRAPRPPHFKVAGEA